jgi:hypothetical protein
VVVTAGKPGEDCASACGRRGRECREWGAIFAHAASAVALDDGGAVRTVVRKPAEGSVNGVYGPLLSVTRWDLPALAVGGGPGGPVMPAGDEGKGVVVTVGTPRLFRCKARTGRRSRRVCPCFNATAVETLVRRTLF